MNNIRGSKIKWTNNIRRLKPNLQSLTNSLSLIQFMISRLKIQSKKKKLRHKIRIKNKKLIIWSQVQKRMKFCKMRFLFHRRSNKQQFLNNLLRSHHKLLKRCNRFKSLSRKLKKNMFQKLPRIVPTTSQTLFLRLRWQQKPKRLGLSRYTFILSNDTYNYPEKVTINI